MHSHKPNLESRLKGVQ